MKKQFGNIKGYRTWWMKLPMRKGRFINQVQTYKSHSQKMTQNGEINFALMEVENRLLNLQMLINQNGTDKDKREAIEVLMRSTYNVSKMVFNIATTATQRLNNLELDVLH